MAENQKPSVLFVSTEVAPFASIGGLSQVAYFLPRALGKLGVDVRIFMPKFGSIDESKYRTEMVYKGLRVPTDDEEGTHELICNVKRYQESQDQPIVYFLENMEYYEKRANVYGYSDDPIRWALLSRGALEFLKVFKDWTPDVIHCNDWETGFLANYLRTTYKEDERLKHLTTVFSIHNLAYQGMFDHRFVSEMDYDDGKSEVASFFNERLGKQNFMRRGIIYSEVVNTVSETYSREILTEEFGEGLSPLLREVRTKVFGVLNGLDYEEFNPAKDKIIKYNYDTEKLAARIKNKAVLQGEFGLREDPNVPIMAIEGRMARQKGLDLLMKVLPFLLSEYDLQFVAMGGGDNEYRLFFEDLEKKFPGKVGTHLTPNWTLPRHIFSGGDIFLLPSIWEPGGIVVMEAMRYGAIPVVRATGGLADVVSDYNPSKGKGTGFSFKNYNEWSLFATIIRALEVFKNKQAWRKLQKRAMKMDFSWEHAAWKYLDLYERALEFRKEQLSPKPHMAYRENE